jgi:hypothetical protein
MEQSKRNVMLLPHMDTKGKEQSTHQLVWSVIYSYVQDTICMWIVLLQLTFSLVETTNENYVP